MKWEPGQAATIKTKNFVLRPLTPADVTDRFVSWFADPKVMQYVDLVMNRNRDQLVEFTSGFDNKSRFIFGIFPKDLDQCIGFFHVYCNFRQSNARTAVVIGDREYWGKKVVPEARSGLLVFLFGTCHCTRCGVPSTRATCPPFSTTRPWVSTVKASCARKPCLATEAGSISTASPCCEANGSNGKRRAINER